MTQNTKDAGAGLKPCPFCSCSICADDFATHEIKRHSIKCPDCPCRMEYFSSTKEEAIAAWNRRAPTAEQAEGVRVDSIARLVAFHAEHLDANPYCYFELAYTRQTDWMAWITHRPAQGEPGTAAYAKSRKVIVRGQGATAEEACADAISALAASSTGDQEVGS